MEIARQAAREHGLPGDVEEREERSVDAEGRAAVLVQARASAPVRRLGAAAQGLVGKYVVLQRYRASKHMWKTVKRIRLSNAKPGVAPTVISSASFGASVPRRTRLRLLLAQDQVGTCYAATRSAVVRV